VTPFPMNTKLFQARTGSHPQRPWWHEQEEGAEWVRPGSGWSLRRLFGVGWRARSPQGVKNEVPADVENQGLDALMAWVDEHHPLPAPILSSGQVWLLSTTNMEFTATLDIFMGDWLARGTYDSTQDQSFSAAELGHAYNEPDLGYRGSALIEYSGGWVLGGRYLTQRAAERLLLKGGTLWTAHMIFDPTNLERLPWTSTRR
jgi:hypothetical protein